MAMQEVEEEEEQELWAMQTTRAASLGNADDSSGRRLERQTTRAVDNFRRCLGSRLNLRKKPGNVEPGKPGESPK